MKHLLALLPLSLIILLVGCQTRSISNSGYGNYNAYPGELSELEVLGVDAGKAISEADIQEALRQRKRISIGRGDTIVLVQSGAQFPDDVMIRHAEQHYRIVPLSGVPARSKARNAWQNPEGIAESEAPLDMSLRLAAARAGARTIVVYWGVLESGRKGYATKTVSWVPIAGYFIPDESQMMRIRLKAAVIDVETGAWEMLTPRGFEDERASAVLNRETSDQSQVERLKDTGYAQLINDIRTRYEL